MPLKEKICFYMLFAVFTTCIALGIVMQYDYLFLYIGKSFPTFKFFSDPNIKSGIYFTLGEILYSFFIFIFLFFIPMFFKSIKCKFLYLIVLLIICSIVFNIMYDFPVEFINLILLVSISVSIIFLLSTSNMNNYSTIFENENSKFFCLKICGIVYVFIFIVSNVVYFELVKIKLDENYAKDGLSLFMFGLSSLLMIIEVLINKKKVDLKEKKENVFKIEVNLQSVSNDIENSKKGQKNEYP